MLQTSPGTTALCRACDTLNLIFLARFLRLGIYKGGVRKERRRGCSSQSRFLRGSGLSIQNAAHLEVRVFRNRHERQPESIDLTVIKESCRISILRDGNRSDLSIGINPMGILGFKLIDS